MAFSKFKKENSVDTYLQLQGFMEALNLTKMISSQDLGRLVISLPWQPLDRLKYDKINEWFN